MTTAERVAHAMRDDGTNIRTADGESFADLCRRLGGHIVSGNPLPVVGAIRTWRFLDQSEISEQHGYCWDYAFPEGEEDE